MQLDLSTLEKFVWIQRSGTNKIASIISTAGSKEIKEDIHGRSKNLALQISKAIGQLKVEISKNIMESWDNKPIRFQDAGGKPNSVVPSTSDLFSDTMISLYCI